LWCALVLVRWCTVSSFSAGHLSQSGQMLGAGVSQIGWTILPRNTPPGGVLCHAIHTRPQAETRQVKVREWHLNLIGKLPHAHPLNAKSNWMTQRGVRIEKILFDSQPGFHGLHCSNLRTASRQGRSSPLSLFTRQSPDGRRPIISLPHCLRVMVSWFCRMTRLDRVSVAVSDPNKRDLLATRRRPVSTRKLASAGLDRGTRWRLHALDAMRALTTSPSGRKWTRNISGFWLSGGGTIRHSLDHWIPNRRDWCGVLYHLFRCALLRLGPQDGEQSIPHFIAQVSISRTGSRQPRRVRMRFVATYSDMFPFAEPDHGHGGSPVLFHLRSCKLWSDQRRYPGLVPPTPTGPALIRIRPTKSLRWRSAVHQGPVAGA